MERNIDPYEVLWLDRSSTWMDPIRVYLVDGALLADQKEAGQVKRRSRWFILYKGILYKRSYTWPLLRCVTPEKGKKILEELHEGVCSTPVSYTHLTLPTKRIV